MPCPPGACMRAIACAVATASEHAHAAPSSALCPINTAAARAWADPPPFPPPPPRRPPVQASLEYILIFVFAADMAATFFVAVFDNENLVTDLRAIRASYLAGKFWLDLLTTIPFEILVLAACGLQDSDTTTARDISLLRLLKLVGGAGGCTGVPAGGRQVHTLPAVPSGGWPHPR